MPTTIDKAFERLDQVHQSVVTDIFTIGGAPSDCPLRRTCNYDVNMTPDGMCIGKLGSAEVCMTCPAKIRSMLMSGFGETVTRWIDEGLINRRD